MSVKTQQPPKRNIPAPYRAIAPVPNAPDLSGNGNASAAPAPAPASTVDPIATYSASVNPPRKAKRQRPISDLNSDEEDEDELASPTAAMSSSAAKRSRASEEDYQSASGAFTSVPSVPNSTSAASRKARAPTRAAREALRKANHSRIEKARRTKINDALARLRELVPAAVGASSGGAGGDANGEEGGAGGEDKGFKLEVLVRTVTYLEKLTEKMRLLEGNAQAPLCSRCKNVEPHKAHRDSSAYPPSSTTSPAMIAADAGPSSRSTHDLSISSLMNPTAPSSPADIRKSVSGSPRVPQSNGRIQLPSPPLSGMLSAEPIGLLPPSLTLPPATSGYASVQGSPTFQPMRTPEDESAATMLLNFKTKWSAHEQNGGSPPSYGNKSSSGSPVERNGTAQTPGSMLGIVERVIV